MGCCGLHVDLWDFLGKILVGWKLSQCSLRLEFYKLGQIEVNVCHCNGNLMRTTHVHEIQTQSFKMVAILCLLHCFYVFFKLCNSSC
jgi:hypothetical protein